MTKPKVRKITLTRTTAARTLGNDFYTGGKFTLMHGIEADTLSYNTPPPEQQKLFAHNILFKAKELNLEHDETKMILEMLGLIDTTGNVRMGNRPTVVTRDAAFNKWR